MARATKGQIIAAAALAIVLALLGAADLLVEHHPYFGIDGWPGFAAAYGVVSGLVAIALAAAFGHVARRGETAADEEASDD